MSFNLNPPLTAKNGRTLKVIVAGRVSNPGPGKQSIESLDDQESMHRDWLRANTDLPVEVTVVAGSGSGEILDRKELIRLEELVATGAYDLVLTEDLGRIARRLQAHIFLEHCVDYSTRLISKNDHIDTFVPGWEDRSIISSWHHERSNRDTSERIKRAHRGRFKCGGALRVLIPGFIKPPGAKTDDDMSKDPYWEPIYDEWFTRLERGQTFAEIADWLNSINAPTGCRRGKKAAKTKYDCQLVGQRTRNSILKGVRLQNQRMSVRVHKTGRRKTVPAPPELRQDRFCSHLVFIEPERYDRVIRLLDTRNGKFARGRAAAQDSRKGVSRKRTKFPGQCTFCGVCGRPYVFGGHGQMDHLMCQGAREHKCWNGVSLDAPLAATKITAAVSHAIASLTDFSDVYLQTLAAEAECASLALDAEIARRQNTLIQTEREAARLLEFLKTGNQSELVRNELQRLDQELILQKEELADAKRSRPPAVVLPTAERLQTLYQEVFRDLAKDSYEFARCLRRLLPRIVVFPYHLCGGGAAVLRARFRLQLASLLPDTGAATALQKPLERLLEVDLFNPPQRARYLLDVIKLRQSGMTEREVATKLGLTVTATQASAKLQRLMDKKGLVDPYIAITDPDDCPKLSRHKHPRYLFEPLANAGQV